MTHGSFFTGILGFDIAAAKVGWDNIFTCEIDPFCQKYINYTSPNTYNHDDIDTFPFERFTGEIDVISGGDPCQPHSLSGVRRGQEDDRYKWPKMLEAIKIIRPTWVVNENVVGTISNMVLDQKISDLESVGYTCQAFNIPIVAINADHERKRIFLIAYSKSKGCQTLCSDTENRAQVIGKKDEEKKTAQLEWNGLHDLLPVDTKEFEERMDQPIISASKDGIPNRVNNKFLHAAGNLVSPGIAYIIFNFINQIHIKCQAK